MSAASDIISAALSRLSNDYRRNSAQYINISARAGSRTPRRHLSDIGFLVECQFTYVSAHRANFFYSDTDTPRALNQIILVGYGLSEDYARITSTEPAARLVRDATAQGNSGVSPYADNNALLVSGALTPETTSAFKTATVVRAMTSPGGPSPHFVITRRGDVIVGPGVDAETTYIPRYAPNGVFVAIESGLIISREDHQARRYDRIMELPPTPLQLTSLGVLINKIGVSAGSALPKIFVDNLGEESPGFTYVWRNAERMPNLSPYNFRASLRAPAISNSNIDYSGTAPSTIFEIATRQGTFDLATQIWRPLAAPTIVSGREEARQAVDAIDTSGEYSAQLGNYVSIAAGARSNEMQAITRQQVFVARHRVAVGDADGAAQVAATAASAVDTTTGLPTEIPQEIAPHTYNFHTGHWGAQDPLTRSTTT